MKTLNNKRSKLMIIMILAIAIGIMIVSAAFADEQDDQGYDLIVLVDNGFSWLKDYDATDTTGYRFDAAAAAFNLLDTAKSRGNYALFNSGISLFSDDSKRFELERNGLISLKDISIPSGKSNRVRILKELTAGNYAKAQRATGGTDIGLALNAAVDALSYYDNGNKKIIILVTDGGYFFTNKEANTEKEKAAKIAKSQELANAAKIKAEEKGITINTILVNDKTATELMQNELRTHDGLFYPAMNASELPECFVQIISSITGITLQATNNNVKSDGQIVINVPNSSVNELSIQIPTDNIYPNSLKLINPDGNELSATSDDYYIVQGDQYSFIKILSPQRGEWKVLYRGKGKNKEITTRFGFRYDLKPVTTVSETDINKTGSITVNTTYKKGTFNATDAELYSIPAKLILSQQNKVIKEFMMNPSEGGYSYTIESMKEYGAGEYTLSVYCEGAGMQKYANAVNVKVSNKQPLLTENNEDLSHAFNINIPGKDESYSIQKWSWDLDHFYTDPDGDALTYHIISENHNINAVIEGTKLKIETIKDTPANEDVIIIATDPDGVSGKETSFHVDVKTVESDVGTIVYGPTKPITKKDDKALFRVQYTVNDTTMTSGDYYQIPAYLTLSKDEKILQSGLEMEYNGEAYTYTIEDLRQFGSGVFKAEIRLQSGCFVRDCEPVQFELLNGIPEISTGYKAIKDVNFVIDDPLDEQSYSIQNQEVDLSSYYSDPDDDPLTWTVKSNDAAVDLKIDGSTLIISTKKNTATNGKVLVGVKDSDGAEGPDFEVNVNVVSVEESVKVEARLSAEICQKHEDVTVKAWFVKNNKAVSKEDTLNTIPLSITLKKGNEIIISSQPMTFEDGISSYTLSGLRKYGAGDYDVVIAAEHQSFRKESAPQRLKLLNSKATLVNGYKGTTTHRFDINIPGDSESYIPRTWTVDLNTLVEDANGDKIHYSIKENTAEVSAAIVNDELVITTEKDKPTSGKVDIGVTDDDGEEGPVLHFNIEVISIEDVYDQYKALFKPVINATKNSDIEVSLYVADEKSQPILNDSYLPAEINAAVQEGGSSRKIKLTRQENGYYCGVIHTKQKETIYEVDAVIPIGAKQIQSERLTINTKDRSPESIKPVSADIKQSMYLGIDKDQQIDLSRYFKDADDDPLTYSIANVHNSDCAEVIIEGSVATIHPVRGLFCFPAAIEFSFVAADQEGLSAESDKISITTVMFDFDGDGFMDPGEEYLAFRIREEMCLEDGTEANDPDEEEEV